MPIPWLSLVVPRTSWRLAHGIVALCLLIAGPSACSLSDLTKAEQPSNLVVEDEIRTEAGARSIYRGALYQFALSYAGNSMNYTVVNGLLSDEFIGSDRFSMRLADATTENEFTGPYSTFHNTRLTMDRALVALRQYGQQLPASYQGEMHALKGYIMVMLAELYCSGIPFTYMRNDGEVVMGMPRTTTQIFHDAIAQFDSAIAIATDSVRIQHLATIGKGRALLNLGEFAAAATTIANVPTAFVSNATFPTSAQGAFNYWYSESTASILKQTIGDREGSNGLDFVSAADPRLVLLQNGYWSYIPGYVPAKLAASSTTPIPLATGIEAALIAAEAAWRAGNADWLVQLNALRTSCLSNTVCPTPAPAGTGGVAGLALLDDPGTDSARVDLLFRERAFWLFATGHRTGDLRRMIRQYGRSQGTLFPVGVNPYLFVDPRVYGVQVNLEPPVSERNNPNYHGCLSRDA